uniref:Uncharacterized protein n=1 Tax=Setaria italica TaxID=4555 RepID=K3YKK2_SETIT
MYSCSNWASTSISTLREGCWRIASISTAICTAKPKWSTAPYSSFQTIFGFWEPKEKIVKDSKGYSILQEKAGILDFSKR